MSSNEKQQLRPENVVEQSAFVDKDFDVIFVFYKYAPGGIRVLKYDNAEALTRQYNAYVVNHWADLPEEEKEAIPYEPYNTESLIFATQYADRFGFSQGKIIYDAPYAFSAAK